MSHPFGDWSTVTPEAMKSYSEEDLFAVMQLNHTGVYGDWAKAELQRRQLLSLQEATQQVHQEVAILSSSSDRMERHTITLKRFTVALIVFAVIQIVIAGVQTWKMFQEAQ